MYSKIYFKLVKCPCLGKPVEPEGQRKVVKERCCNKTLSCVSAVTFLIMLLNITAHASIRLPRLIGNGMVLQRDTKLKLWGWASPGEKVSLSFNKLALTTVAAKDSTWSIMLPPQPTGGPYEMKFTGENEIVIKDILFGDVWLCSGQSNMEFTMFQSRFKYPDVIENAYNPNIRQFEVPDRYSLTIAEKDLNGGSWQPVNKENIVKFSAVAYFFANDLYSRYKIPIGLINAAWGGSPAQAWISEDSLKSFPGYAAEAKKWSDTAFRKSVEDKERTASQKWQSDLDNADEGEKGNWKDPALDDATWETLNIPGFWADQGKGHKNGVVWVRKTVIIPHSMTVVPAEIQMGRIVDADSVFINGSFVGTTGYQYPQRRYAIPAGVLKQGSNTIVVRVVNQASRGGFVQDKPYAIITAKDTVDLKGAWKFKQGAVANMAPGQTVIRFTPAALYKGVIAPLVNYNIKGAIWYQGESNTGNPAEYLQLMTTLINDWRSRFSSGDFPFLTVQLANFMDTTATLRESNWAALRQQQLNLLSVKNTSLTVAIDIGEWNDIHPLNKKEVGRRLSLQAQRMVYGDKKIVSSGPLYQSVKKEANKLVISFTNTGSGLKAAGDGHLHYFAIAGADKKFVWAQAAINGKTVHVWNDAIANPMYVRYAWADDPIQANLYNKEGLPASPFEASVKEVK